MAKLSGLNSKNIQEAPIYKIRIKPDNLSQKNSLHSFFSSVLSGFFSFLFKTTIYMTKIKNRYPPKSIRIRSYKLVKAPSSSSFFPFLFHKLTIFMAKVKKNRYLPNENQDMAIKIRQNSV